MTIEISHLNRRFGEFVALDDVSLSIARGEFIALLGPSGSGKTTLLRILAGLDTPDHGRVEQQGRDLLALPPHQRRTGLVFQHYALFRHLTVSENIAFGLRVRPRRQRPGRSEITARVNRLLKRVQLDALGSRYPGQLSGGQRQRVALARALAVEPELLLLDEPFGALDASVRVALRRWLRSLHDELGLTTVFVTHDQEEALELADRIAVVNHGRIEQIGSSEEIYQHPRTPFVCEFIGKTNRLRGQYRNGVLLVGGLPLGTSPGVTSDSEAIAYVRPEHLALASNHALSGWAATVRHVYFSGSLARVELDVPAIGSTLESELGADEARHRNLQAGVTVTVLPRSAVVFPVDPANGLADIERRHVIERPGAQLAVANGR